MEPSTNKPRPVYTCDVTDAEWEFCQPYLELMRPDAPQRQYPLRELSNALRYFVRCGCQWRLMPHDLPPWQVVYQQAQRWMNAGCFEVMAHDLRELARAAKGLQSSPESGARAGFDGYKKRNGSKVHIAVDTLGHLLAVKVTPANEQERAQVGELAAQIQEATRDNGALAWAYQGYTGQQPAQDAAVHGIRLDVVKLSEAKKGFVLLPRRWVVGYSFG